MTAQTIALVLLLGGCLGAGVESSTPEPEGAPRAESTLDSLTDIGSASDTLSAAQRERCDMLLPTAPERPLLVVGRSVVGGGELIRVAWAARFDGDLRTQPETQLLYLIEDACADPEIATVDVPWAALRALHASPTVNDRLASLEIETEGGLESAQREVDLSRETSIAIRECWPGEAFAESACVRPELAAAYRRAGLQVESPERLSPRTSADLTAIPDSLRGCVPAVFRSEPGEVVLLGEAADGPYRLLAFERFGGSAQGAAYNTHISGARQDPTGECSELDPAYSDATSEATTRLTSRPDIARRSAAEHVRRARGTDAYLALVRNPEDPQAPYLCGEGQIPEDHRCITAAKSAALEAAGVPVHAPRSF